MADRDLTRREFVRDSAVVAAGAAAGVASAAPVDKSKIVNYNEKMEYRPLGEGSAEIATQITLLRGQIYSQYAVFEWPKLWDSSLPAPETVLPVAVKFLRERVEEQQAVLSAYKGDKCATRYASPSVG